MALRRAVSMMSRSARPADQCFLGSAGPVGWCQSAAQAFLIQPLHDMQMVSEERRLFSSQTYPPWENDSESDAASSRSIEQAIAELRFRNSVPAWLPFIPGGSYWLPPESEKVSEKPEIPDAEFLAKVVPAGWPTTDCLNGVLCPAADEETEMAEEDRMPIQNGHSNQALSVESGSMASSQGNQLSGVAGCWRGGLQRSGLSWLPKLHAWVELVCGS